MNPDLMKDFLLTSFPNPERKGCPAEGVIQDFAEDRLSAADQVALHIASCSECYAEYLHYREDWKAMQPSTHWNKVHVPASMEAATLAAKRTTKPWRYRVLALAAALIVMFTIGFYTSKYSPQQHISQAESSRPIEARVDLFENGTFRGSGESTTPPNQITLPAAIVHLSLVLPRFSDPGIYKINITTEKDDNHIVSSGAGNATESKDEKVSLTVMLDLRKAKPGTYFLSTVRGADNGTYFYPLQIK